eukprot:m.132381 g.132381  ORF g.132381 m.132381 type:complete len:204 (-) comp9483_c1_seq1:643-1254(-)
MLNMKVLGVTGLLLSVAMVMVAIYCGVNAVPGLKGACINQTAVKDMTVPLDAKRYLGGWFDQARSTSAFFNRNCYCTTANYTVLSDGLIGVRNACNKDGVNGTRQVVVGKAEQPDPVNHPGFLQVWFFSEYAKGPYEVLATDYDTFSIVASCSELGGSLIWILTREPIVSDAFVQKYVNLVESWGFDTSDLERTLHTDKCVYN